MRYITFKTRIAAYGIFQVSVIFFILKVIVLNFSVKYSCRNLTVWPYFSANYTDSIVIARLWL